MPNIGDSIVIPIEDQIANLARKVNRNRKTAGMSDAEYASFVRREAAARKAAQKAMREASE